MKDTLSLSLPKMVDLLRANKFKSKFLFLRKGLYVQYNCLVQLFVPMYTVLFKQNSFEGILHHSSMSFKGKLHVLAGQRIVWENCIMLMD